MPRLPKKGLDYFPIDLDMDQDDKIFMIEAELGELAFGRLIKLLMDIYRNGYIKKWGEEEALIFAGKKRIPVNELKELVNAAIKRGFFDERLWITYGVLTSSGIQKRYIKACENRNQIVIEEKYKLFDVDDFSEKIKSRFKFIKSDEKPVKTDTKPIIPDPGTQSKAKERRGKQSKGNDACVPVDNPPPPEPPPEDPAGNRTSGSSPPNGFISQLAHLLDDNMLFDPFRYDRKTIQDLAGVLCRQEAADLNYVRLVLLKTHGDHSVETPEGYFIWAVKNGKYLAEWRARASPG